MLPAMLVPQPYPVISKCQVEGSGGATKGSGGGFLVGRSAATAGAAPSAAARISAPEYFTHSPRPKPRDRPPLPPAGPLRVAGLATRNRSDSNPIDSIEGNGAAGNSAAQSPQAVAALRPWRCSRFMGNLKSARQSSRPRPCRPQPASTERNPERGSARRLDRRRRARSSPCRRRSPPPRCRPAEALAKPEEWRCKARARTGTARA